MSSKREAGSGPELPSGRRRLDDKRTPECLKVQSGAISFPAVRVLPATKASPIAVYAHIRISSGAVNRKDGRKWSAAPGKPGYSPAILLTSQGKILYLKIAKLGDRPTAGQQTLDLPI
jgi:hypothetical protein